MSIRYAVLALLAEGPMHGYAIHASLERRLGDFWELNHGQVYQVLTALERQGLVVASDVQVGRRPVRRVYTLRPEGYDEFRGWIRDGECRPRPFRDGFFIRLLLAPDASPSQLLRMIDDEVERLYVRLTDLELQREAPARNPVTHPATVLRLYVEAAILHLKASVKALQLCRDAFARLEAATRVESVARTQGAERADSRKKKPAISTETPAARLPAVRPLSSVGA